MKKNFLLLAALASIVLAGCTVQIASPETPDTPEETVVPGVPVTFSATLPETKSFGTDGKVKWETTDFIYISTDKATMTIASGAPTNGVKVSLADAVISEDGKTATFTVSGLAADATKYYAAVVDKGDANCILSAIWSSGEVLPQIGKMGGMNYNHKYFLAVASCTPDNTALHFKIGCSVIKFQNPLTSGSGPIQKLVITGGNGESLCHYYSIHAETQAVELRDHSYNRTEINYNYAKYTEYNYIFLAPGQTFSKGLVIKGYSDADATQYLGTYTTKAFTSAAGTIYDLEDISTKLEKTYSSLWEKWEDGKNIKIGDKTYNKKTFTGTVTHVTSNSTDLSVYGGGAFFVDPGLTVNFKGLGTSNNNIEVFVIGTDPTQRSAITLSGDPYANCMAYKVAFSNVAITYGNTGQKMFRTYGNKNMGYLVFDNCRINYGSSFVADGQIVEDLQILNSDICLENASQNHMNPMMRQPGTKTGTSINFVNNVLFASSFKKLCMVGNTSMGSTDVTFGTVNLSNNSFYNVAFESGDYALLNLKDVTTSATINSNIVYAPSSASYDRCMRFLVSGTAGICDKTTATGNKVNVYVQGNGYAWGSYATDGTNSKWIGPSDVITEDPFISFNTTTGAFVKKEAYEGVGATR